MRASAPEYNAWSQLGNPGWTWENLVPSFKRSEKYQSPEWTTEAVFPGITKEDHENSKRLALHYKGHEGPIHHTHNVIYTDVLRPCVLTLNNLGIKTSCCPVSALPQTIRFNQMTQCRTTEMPRAFSISALPLTDLPERVLTLAIT